MPWSLYCKRASSAPIGQFSTSRTSGSCANQWYGASQCKTSTASSRLILVSVRSRSVPGMSWMVEALRGLILRDHNLQSDPASFGAR